ncbi:MAG: class F sortase [Patescibacteria group bacterium]
MKSLKFILVLIITITAFSVIVFILYKNSVAARPEPELPIPEKFITSEVVATSTEKHSYPYRLIIPSIELNAGVQHVGINQKGNMANPAGFKDVGWYKYGPIPGQKGSAVIAGHFDNGLGLPAVFYELNELQVGDDIYVQDEDGKKLLFKIIQTKQYDYMDTAASQEVFKSSDKVMLNLITCDGTWIKDQKTYTKRFVVFAELNDKVMR